jgi:seryl-tRNA synthetase
MSEKCLKEEYDNMDKRLDKLLDDNQSGKIDDASFSCLVALLQIERKLLPYHDELQKPEVKLFANIGLVFGLISDKYLTPKEEQEVKNNLKRIKDIQNDLESGKTEKEQDISRMAEQIDDLLMVIIGVLSGK